MIKKKDALAIWCNDAVRVHGIVPFTHQKSTRFCSFLAHNDSQKRSNEAGEDYSMFRILEIILMLFLAINFSGCSLLKMGIASLKSTSDFHPLEADNRVLAEPGAETLAEQVASSLPEAVSIIEKEQYRAFAGPLEIFVCASEDSFVSHAGLSKKVRGAIITKLFLSGKLNRPEFNESTKAVLIHELSHLHLQQQLGLYAYNAHVSAWFQEGLAVLVSNGGGAENVSEAEAVKAVVTGTQFAPEAQGSFWRKRSGSSYGLEPHMFYRQASLFVGYLKELSALQFGLFMLSIEDGEDFGGSFQRVYGMSIDEAWQDFVAQLRHKQCDMQFAGMLRQFCS